MGDGPSRLKRALEGFLRGGRATAAVVVNSVLNFITAARKDFMPRVLKCRKPFMYWLTSSGRSATKRQLTQRLNDQEEDCSTMTEHMLAKRILRSAVDRNKARCC